MSVNYNPQQYHSGPGGAVTASELQLVELYAEIASSNLTYSQDFIQVASQMGLATAIADQQAGYDQAQATRCQAIQSGVDAGLTLGTAAFTIKGTTGLNSEADKMQSELNTLKNLNSSLQARALEEPNLELREGTDTDPNVTARIRELKAGQYTTSRIDTDQTIEETNSEAIKALHNDELTSIRKGVEQEIANKHEAINAKFSQIQTTTQNYQQRSAILNQIAGAGAQAGQAHWQQQQGIEQGNAALASTASSMANSALENQRSQNSGYFSMISTVLQALKAASSAYAG